MQIRIFNIPISDNGESQAELNRFLAGQKVLEIGCLIVNLLVTIIKQKAANKKMSFALTVSIIRQFLMNYLTILEYLKHPNGLRAEFKKSYPFRKNYNTQASLLFNIC